MAARSMCSARLITSSSSRELQQQEPQRARPMLQQVQPEQRTQQAQPEQQMRREQPIQPRELQPVLQRAFQPHPRRLGNP